MEFTVYSMSVQLFIPMLQNLSALLDKGAQRAAARGFDPGVLVNARLSADMFPLAQQIRIACDQAKGAAARLRGLEPPVHEDKEQTLEELKARVARTIAYLQGATPAEFQGAEQRLIRMPLRDDMVLEAPGARYLRDWALPNFYFHVVTAYDILRHNGVEIGKRDYLGAAAGGMVRQSAGSA
jgi:uncharacterized protein